MFDDAFAVDDQRIVGGKHLRLVLSRDGMRYAAILWNSVDALPARVRAAYRPEINEWNGSATLQLAILHWQPE